ncbi:apolipoprotein M-like [Gadus macrocephalus]|uniref:apolipoprotein M-like n=1 Tax=Gadus macrocephalus TaxID=80720 RepID=UPI0028CB7776|nr:apolipoprotein M-like [Gadus macrocephalus]
MMTHLPTRTPNGFKSFQYLDQGVTMPKNLASLLLYVYCMWVVVSQPCPTYTALSVDSLNPEEYLGRWYFSAAVSGREEELQWFRMMDSSVFTMQKTAVPQTLLLNGDIRIGNNCIRSSMTYKVLSGRNDVELEGRPQRKTFFWGGAQHNDSDYIIVQETEPAPAALDVYMLYGRKKVLPDDVIKDFQEILACQGMTAFFRLPQTQELCS